MSSDSVERGVAARSLRLVLRMVIVVVVSVVTVVLGLRLVLSGITALKGRQDGHPVPIGVLHIELTGEQIASGGPDVVVVEPEDRLAVTIRHEAPQDAMLVFYVLALPLSGAPLFGDPHVLINPSPRYVRHVGSTIHYDGMVSDVLPLRNGVWQLTFLVGDALTCRPEAVADCREVHTWIQIGQAS